jgi:hypothetical protein
MTKENFLSRHKPPHTQLLALMADVQATSLMKSRME